MARRSGRKAEHLRVFGWTLEPLVRLSFAAGATERIGLGTNVIVLPYRSPLLLANEAVTLDVISGGRFALGVGARWNRDEAAVRRAVRFARAWGGYMS